MASEYKFARELMTTMVEHSQLPGQGSEDFVSAVSQKLQPHHLALSTHRDPQIKDRHLLAVDIGDPGGDQILVASSHCDVVGVEGQKWDTDPHQLNEKDGWWIGRGTCDTHGSGVAMLLAGLNRDVREPLIAARKRITILFTYDEEAVSEELSMRGARFAAGLLGSPSIVHARNYIAGEPTERNGIITPMRAHKGRFLGQFNIAAPGAAHVSKDGPNAIMTGTRVIRRIVEFAERMRRESEHDTNATIYDVPRSTVQVTAGDIKKGDFSTAPREASFVFDMRTLPHEHERRVRQMTILMQGLSLADDEAGTTLQFTPLKNGLGSATSPDSRIVHLAEEVTGQHARGFNGGDEGRIFRNGGVGMEGITLGPGSLEFAHMANERVQIASVFRAADLYAEIFRRMAR